MKKRTLLLFSFIFLILSARSVHAARFSFDPEEHSVGTTGPFVVALLLDSKEPLNALTVKVHLPPNVKVVDFSDADSIINYWIDTPIYDEAKGTFVFSGLIPGGYTGTGARLGVLTLQATSPGVSVLDYDRRETYSYKHGPAGEKLPLSVSPLTLMVVTGKDNIGSLSPDHENPESFKPELVRIPDAESPWHVAFQAQDKGTGIKRYEVSESAKKTSDFNSLEWQAAVSPYRLLNQEFTHYIYVKAIDASGNERVMVVAPINNRAWPLTLLSYILISILVGFGLWKFRAHAQSSH